MSVPKGFAPLDSLGEVKGQKRANGWMGSRTYIAGGVAPTDADKVVFETLSVAAGCDAGNPHLCRWYQHMLSFSPAERAAFGGATGAAAPAAAPKAKAKAKKAAPAADDDDEDDDLDDMFGDSDDDEEAEAAKQAVIDKIAAAHNAKKEASRIAKGKAKRRDINSYIFDVKPYEIETDLEKMAQDFKAVTHGGIKAWGVEHKLIPVAFGIKKLRIQVITYGDDGEGNEFGEDDLMDIFNEIHEDDIQSVDTHSFTKM
jgi:elongation factor 1-beta